MLRLPPLSRDEVSVHAEQIARQLEKRATAKTKAFWMRTLKGALPVRGVSMVDTRKVVHAYWTFAKLDTLRLESQRGIALALLAREHVEDKLAGILFLHEKLIKSLGSQDLPSFAKLFESKAIADWSTCDWFAVKVLANLLKIAPEPSRFAKSLASWRKGSTLWQKRAAAVALVPSAKLGNRNFAGFVEVALQLSSALLQSKERFAQTGAGWLLRELWLASRGEVERYLRDNLKLFTREGLSYATRKMPAARRKVFVVAYQQLTKIV